MPWLLAYDFVRSSMHPPIRLSGIARFLGWIRSAGEALFRGVHSASPLESIHYGSSAIMSTFVYRKYMTNKGPVAD